MQTIDYRLATRRVLIHQCVSCLAPTATAKGSLCPACLESLNAELDAQARSLLVAVVSILVTVYAVAELLQK